MKNIVLIGGGGHCRSVLDSLLSDNIYDNVYVSDPSVDKTLDIYRNVSLIDSDDLLPDLVRKWQIKGIEAFAHIAVGGITNLHNRKIVFEKVKQYGFTFSSIYDKTSVISNHAYIGDGCFVGKNATVNGNAKIGNHTIVNTGCIIEHDCQMGNFSHISTGAILCGSVSVGDVVFIGAGTTVIQGLTIGDGAIIGAGSLVLRDVAPNERVVGTVK